MALVWSAVTCCIVSSACQLALHGFDTALAPTEVSPNHSSLGFPFSSHSIKPILTAKIPGYHGVMISS